jgi:hypothetical protein
MARQRQIVAILGASGTGKTTLARAMIKGAVERGERVRVLDPGHQFGGLGVMPLDVDDWLAERIEARDTSFLYIDDAEACTLPTAPGKASPWRHVYSRNRWLPMDVLVSARRAQALAPSLLASVRFVFLFWLSPADVPGLRRIQEYAPGLVLPGEKFRFVRVNLEDGSRVNGRTLAGGGFVYE